MKPLERITQAAQECFKKYGVEKTTMEDVAKVAEISRPNIYRYAKNRDELVKLVIVHVGEKILQEIEIPEGNWKEQLRALCAEMIRRCIEEEIYRVFVKQAENVSSQALIHDEKAFESIHLIMHPVLKKASESGELRDDLSIAEIFKWLNFQMWTLSEHPMIVEAFRLEEYLDKFILGCLLKERVSSKGASSDSKPYSEIL